MSEEEEKLVGMSSRAAQLRQGDPIRDRTMQQITFDGRRKAAGSEGGLTNNQTNKQGTLIQSMVTCEAVHLKVLFGHHVRLRRTGFFTEALSFFPD